MGLHASQLAFDDDEPLVDELGGVDGHLVLVVDGLLVVDRDQHVQHVFRPCGGAVLKGEGENRGLVLLLPDAETGDEVADHRREGILRHLNMLAHPGGRVVVGRGDDEPHSLHADRVLHPDRQFLVAVDRTEVGDNHLAAVHRGHDHAQPRLGSRVQEADRDRRLLVELRHLEAVLDFVVDVGVDAAHNLPHQFLGPELEDLVGDVHLVDVVVVAVKARRGDLVGRILDDHGGGAEIGLRSPGVLEPGQAAEHYHGNDEPFPFGEQEEQDVDDVDILIVSAGGIVCLHIR